MDDATNFVSAKRARARRALIIKASCSKRLRHTPNHHQSFFHQLTTPNLVPLRIPLSEITPSQQNRKTVAQVVEEGQLLTAEYVGSEPSHTKHVFHPTKQFSKVHCLGTNLLSKFSDVVPCKQDENSSHDIMVSPIRTHACHISHIFDVGEPSIARNNGKVELSLLKQPPDLLSRLLFDDDNIFSRKFQQQIRISNMMFAFTSPGAKLDNSFNKGGGPPTLWIQGQSCHRIGSLLPPESQPPKFAQLYIFNTDNEVQNRT
ncbi:hypothetical protein KIW84_052976 [Lathyrus oleraceus]|uniref:Uncharacterized protein n=1 Tax=Pisum sativum TaxID=3888 RepID=A0A9D5AFL6_PEA|nr:hypothetical protein KIW84_052976 [Pisum sativum]